MENWQFQGNSGSVSFFYGLLDPVFFPFLTVLELFHQVGKDG